MQNPQSIKFPEGLPGFETVHQYDLIPHENNLYQLLSSENSHIGFVLINTTGLFESYHLDEKIKRLLKADDFFVHPDVPEAPIRVYHVLAVSSDTAQSTVNLKAPILIQRNMGKQVILDGDLPLRAPLFGKE